MREQGEREEMRKHREKIGGKTGEKIGMIPGKNSLSNQVPVRIYTYLSAVAYDILTLQFLVYILQSNTKHLENIFLNLKNQSTFLSIKPCTEMYTILNSRKMKRSVAGEEKELNRDFKLHILT